MRLIVTLIAVVSCSCSAEAQRFESLPAGIHGSGVFSIAVGDVDGDGDSDVVLGQDRSNNRLLLNDGFGRFVDATRTNMPFDDETPFGMVLVDVDGDRDLDLFCANSTWKTGQNRLFLNDGRGRFTDGTSGRVPVGRRYSVCVESGDFDKDGDIDLVVGNSEVGAAGQDKLLLNDGRGKFTDVTSSRYANQGTYTTDIAVGDVDGDGDLDILPSTYHYSGMWLNDGRGSFRAVASPLRKFTSVYLALGDVDGDGDLDLVGSGNVKWLYINDGRGRFTERSTGWPRSRLAGKEVVLVDVEGDGDLDAVFANARMLVCCYRYLYGNQVYLNDGRGNFADFAGIPQVNASSMSVVASDLDQDGDADLLFANQGTGLLHHTNLHRQVIALDQARLSRPFRLRFTAQPGYATRTQTVWPVLNLTSVTPRLYLPPLGHLGVDPNGAILGVSLRLAAPRGDLTLPLTVPNDSRLIGRTIYVQALVQHGMRDRLTNVVTARVSR